MSLASLIRGKSAPNKFATATPATSATPDREKGLTVATVATVAFATARKPISATPAKVGAGDTATASRWLIHFADHDPIEVACCPEASHADILERYPDAAEVEPFAPTVQQPSTPMSAIEEAAIREWLERIAESDQKAIETLIAQCGQDQIGRMQILKLAERCCDCCQRHRRPGLVDGGYCTGRDDPPSDYGLMHQVSEDEGPSYGNWQ
jgi:hypothetical protein